jgi:pyridoxal phosphate enzyme (YggS family)
MSFGDLPERLSRVREDIARHQAAGQWSHPVTIIAVTKGFGPDAVRAARDAGLADVGENRVQEALDKMAALAGGVEVRWHLIGHLQRNKARHVPGRFALVHSLDSLELADELDRRAAAAGTTVPVLIQVNVAREPQKSGCDPSAVPALARALAARTQLRLEGLMTMAPFTDDESVQRGVFRGLRELRDRVQEEGAWLPTLSMGMSGDFATAVAEGATVVRLGTVLFGPRRSP